MDSEEEASSLAEKLVEAISKPYELDSKDLNLSASIGAVIFPTQASDRHELMAYADTAMHTAKRNSTQVAMYRTEMTEALVRKRALDEKLSSALDNNEFKLVFQPQVDIRVNRIVSFEALMRWEHQGTTISPVEFIPLLEKSGQIIEVGNWVLKESCRQLEAWRKMGYEVHMGVNISPLQFRDPEFVSNVIDTINQFEIDPCWIDLEITESLLVEEIDEATGKLFELKEFGTMFSVDDFGTGYSSLAYLKHFPIDRLKIDRTFIKDIPDHDDGTVAACIIVLGQSLGMEVLAEGIETTTQLDFISEQGCDMFQGYFTSAPLPGRKMSGVDGRPGRFDPRLRSSFSQVQLNASSRPEPHLPSLQ